MKSFLLFISIIFVFNAYSQRPKDGKYEFNLLIKINGLNKISDTITLSQYIDIGEVKISDTVPCNHYIEIDEENINYFFNDSVESFRITGASIQIGNNYGRKYKAFTFEVKKKSGEDDSASSAFSFMYNEDGSIYVMRIPNNKIIFLYILKKPD